MKNRSSGTVKRNYKKRRTNKNFKAPLVRNYWNPSRRFGPGTKQVTTLSWCSNGRTVTPGAAGAPGFYVFRINNLFTIDVLQGSKQPTLYDQYANMFEQYCVTGCKYKVSLNPTDASLSYICGVFAHDRNFTTTDTDTVLQQGSCQWKVNNPVAGVPSDFSGYVDIPALMGRTRSQYISDGKYNAEFGSDPTDLAFLYVFAASNTNAQPAAMRFTVEFTLYATLTGGAVLPNS